MPPRAARSSNTNSVSVAVKRHLCNAAASPVAAASNGRRARATIVEMPALEADAAASNQSSSRVSRRRRDVVPQETPEWQRMALKTAAAAASRKSRASAAKKTKPNGRRRGPPKGRAESDEDEDEAAPAAELSSQRGEEDADHSASHAEINASSSISSKRARPHRGKAEKAAATPAPKRGQRVPVAELVCPRCRLRMDHWPFCGLSGDAHVLRAPPSAAREEDEARPKEAAAAAAAH
ncbi:hypothetical protein CGC21_16180 [Leishmania donovani]|uniref:Uncharacterized protein n=1 Tax=Leishmania donovani TaxID=5661 RepID=A0A3S7WYB7_LEIDO|nr:hypothetical protein LdCL_240016400 [Leishmania donovani]TPP52241.1 hypothetical protein CGC21_16180 [Leishmania donovani]